MWHQLKLQCVRCCFEICVRFLNNGQNNKSLKYNCVILFILLLYVHTYLHCHPAYLHCHPAYLHCHPAYLHCHPACLHCHPAYLHCHSAYLPCHPAYLHWSFSVLLILPYNFLWNNPICLFKGLNCQNGNHYLFLIPRLNQWHKTNNHL